MNVPGCLALCDDVYESRVVHYIQRLIQPCLYCAPNEPRLNPNHIVGS